MASCELLVTCVTDMHETEEVFLQNVSTSELVAKHWVTLLC